MKHISNRLLSLTMTLLTVIGLASCADDNDNCSQLPQIFIEQPYYTLAKGEVTISVAADVAPLQDISIPLRFAGSAVRDIDFETEDAEVTIKAGETEGSITLKRLDIDNLPEENLELFINLTGAPSGYSLGLMNYASVNLLGRNGYIMTFSQPTGEVGLDGEFKIQLYDMKGSLYRPKADEYFTVVIDEEQSTAIEGVHYELPDGKVIKYAANAREGSIKINMLKVEQGMDKIVLTLADKDGYALGDTPMMTVTIKGPDNFSGNWVFDHFNLDDVLMYADWGVMVYPELAPTGSSADMLIISGDTYKEYTFTPQLTGDLKKYFGTSSRKMTFIKEDKEFRDQTGAFPMFTRFSLPDINFAFSSKVSDEREGQIALKFVTEGGVEYLELWIGDWIPVDDEFGGELYYWIYDDTYMWGYCPIKAYFTRK